MDITINDIPFAVAQGEDGYYLAVYLRKTHWDAPAAFSVLCGSPIMQFLEDLDQGDGFMPEVPLSVYKKLLLWT